MRERELFLEALDIADPAARARFLDRACRADGALRAGVDALLAWHARGEGWLEEPLPERLAASHRRGGGEGEPSDDADRVGHVVELAPGPDDPRSFGRVRILEPLPATSFGRAWAGVDDASGAVVVVKTLDAAWARDPQARGRFLATARALETLRRNSLPRVVALGERPLPWIAFERVDAVPLSRRAASGMGLVPEATFRVAAELAAALAAIHDAGLVHRVLSPEFVLVPPDADAPRVWLADAGLAHALGGPAVPVPPGAWPGFLAPEQVLAHALHPLDHRPDLFALGCVFVFLATGRSPFDSASPDGVLRRVADVAPRPEVMRALPPTLGRVVADLLRADPAARPPSAHDVVSRLAGEASRGP